MNHTPENLREMSEFEINKEVAKILGISVWSSGKYLIPNSNLRGDHLNYCQSPSDIMPIAIENRFNMTPSSDGGYNVNYHASPNIHHWSHHENLYRAICEVFILMMQEKSDD